MLPSRYKRLVQKKMITSHMRKPQMKKKLPGTITLYPTNHHLRVSNPNSNNSNNNNHNKKGV